MIIGFIIGASILASARIIANALTSRQSNQNRVTRTSRAKRATRTWDALANEATTIGDRDRTCVIPALQTRTIWDGVN